MKIDNIEYIIGKVPTATRNNNLLVIAFWKLCDKIDIPDEVAKEIIDRGTSVETITRSRRKVIKKLSKNL